MRIHNSISLLYTQYRSQEFVLIPFLPRLHIFVVVTGIQRRQTRADDEQGGQFWRASTHVRASEGSVCRGQDSCETLGHRQGHVQEDTHGLHHQEAEALRGISCQSSYSR